MAPLIAGILTSLVQNNLPKLAQAVLDKGVDYVQEKTGMELKPDMAPEDVQKLREHELELEKLESADRDSARKMQMSALEQDDVFSKRFIYYYASFWSLCAAVYIGFITFGSIPDSNIRFADTILGFLLGTVISTIVQFFFGSSMSSKNKTEAMLKK